MRALGHAGLLTLARGVCAAARTGDSRELALVTRRFDEAFTSHVAEEAGTLVRVEPAEARMLVRGQARVGAAAARLLAEAASGCAGPAEHCASSAEHLLALLMVQARDERAAIHLRCRPEKRPKTVQEEER